MKKRRELTIIFFGEFFSLRLLCFGLDVGHQNVVMIAAMETGLGEFWFKSSGT